LEDFASKYKNVKIIFVTEHHWKSCDYSKYNISNYTIGSVYSRSVKKHGGSIILVQDIECTERNDIKKLSVESHFECSALDFTVGEINFTAVCIYRPPKGDLKLFYNKLEAVKNKIRKCGREPIIAGDFNINLLDTENNDVISFQEVLSICDLNTLITKPTRICDTTATLIDNVCVSSDLKGKILKVQVKTFVRSDHKAQVVTMPEKIFIKQKLSKKLRIFSDKNIINFKNSLLECKWEDVYNETNSEKAFNNFHS
jgi:hypothetical protein